MTATGKQSEKQAQPDDIDVAAAEEAAGAAASADGDEAASAAKVVQLSPEGKRIVALEDEVEALSHKLRVYSESVDRMRREFEASKGRIQREHERSLEGDKVKAVTGLLGVLDDLDQALAAVETETPFVQGVRMIQKDCGTALAKLGLQRFEAMGEMFDPERHEALTVMPVPDAAQHNKVVHVMKQGAIVGEKVVRAATVVVGKHAGEQAPPVN